LDPSSAYDLFTQRDLQRERERTREKDPLLDFTIFCVIRTSGADRKKKQKNLWLTDNRRGEFCSSSEGFKRLFQKRLDAIFSRPNEKKKKERKIVWFLGAPGGGAYNPIKASVTSIIKYEKGRRRRRGKKKLGGGGVAWREGKEDSPFPSKKPDTHERTTG
jgi:hypothetical protein